MIAIAFGIWIVAAVPPEIDGGTPEQRKLVTDAMAQLPTCWRAADGKEPPIVITNDVLVKVKDDDPKHPIESYYVTSSELPGDHRGDLIWLSPGFFYVAFSSRPFETSCAGPSYSVTPMQVLAHELAHRMEKKSRGALVRKFLAIRYQAMHDRVVNDPDYKAAIALGDDGGCPQESLMEQALARANVPRRIPGDAYALENDGDEYFAIAIEMMAGHPQDFCRFFSAEEREFLAMNFGSCLAEFPSTPPCLWEWPAPAPSGDTGNMGFHH